MQRVLTALDTLCVRAVCTLGPALDPTRFVAPPNVVLERFVPHGAVLPKAAAVVTQCGIGTVIKSLAHGVPLVCLPLIADQPDNAARVVARGAGLRLPKHASPEQIQRAVQQVLFEPKFREAARRLASNLTQDAAENAVIELEAMAQAVASLTMP